MNRENQFLFINEVYFGATYNGTKTDKTRDYISNDFSKVLYDLIHHDIIVYVLSHDPKRYENLTDMIETFDQGFLIDLRKLLKAERRKIEKRSPYFTGTPGSCTGGDFIDDLSKLEENQLDELIEIIQNFDSKLAKLTFSDAHNNFRQLQDKVRAFKNQDYYRQLVKSNEALRLHKDHASVKRKIVKQKVVFNDNPTFPVNQTVYRTNFNLEVREIAECLNKLAEIIYIYQSIMFIYGVSFYIPHSYSLENYIEKCFTMFGSKEEFKTEINITTESIIKNLKTSLDISHWQYRQMPL